MIQQFIQGITEYRIKTERRHAIQRGRGVTLPAAKSPRMPVDESQLDHFLCFITNPYVVQDLPFGQQYLYLTNGKILETPNDIRSMMPQRITDQYRQFSPRPILHLSPPRQCCAYCHRVPPQSESHFMDLTTLQLRERKLLKI